MRAVKFRWIPSLLQGLKPEQGLSLLDLIASIAMIAILTSVALPSYRAMNASISRGDAVRQVEFDLRRAKSEAIAAGARVVFLTNADGREYSVGFDYTPFSNPAVADVSLFRYELPSTIALPAATTLIFDSRGFLVDTAGDPTTSNFSIVSDNDPYCIVTVASTGLSNFDCGGA